MKKFSDYPRHIRFPFNEDETIEVRKGVRISGNSFIIVRGYRTRDEYIPQYAEMVKEVFGLSKKAQRLLEYILWDLVQGQQKVTLDMDVVIPQVGYAVGSEGIMYKGLSELIECRLLAKTERPKVYFVNPILSNTLSRLQVVNEIQIGKTGQGGKTGQKY